MYCITYSNYMYTYMVYTCIQYTADVLRTGWLSLLTCSCRSVWCIIYGCLQPSELWLLMYMYKVTKALLSVVIKSPARTNKHFIFIFLASFGRFLAQINMFMTSNIFILFTFRLLLPPVHICVPLACICTYNVGNYNIFHRANSCLHTTLLPIVYM